MTSLANLKLLHKATITDIKRNYILMVILEKTSAEKDHWIAYAVFLYITTLSAPLLYYIRYSDKNRRIISTVVNTKLPKVQLYQYLLGFYHVVIFSVEYGILTLAAEIKYPGKGPGICLFVSVVFLLCITNGLCILLLLLFKRYYIGFIVYIAVCVFFLSSGNSFIGFFYPLNDEVYGMQYFAGKLIEVLSIGAGSILLLRAKKL